MTIASKKQPTLLAFLMLALIGSTIGCQSGGSKWARWNPWSKSTDDATLVAKEEPALPTENATPVIETLDEGQNSAPAYASTSTPAASATAEASAPAYPTTSSPITTPPAEQPPATQPPASSIASAGPYDPGAYEAKAAAEAESMSTQAKPTDRYASTLGNRYGSAETEPQGNFFEDLPDFSQPPTQPAATGDRYAAATPAAGGVAPPVQEAAVASPTASPSPGARYPSTQPVASNTLTTPAVSPEATAQSIAPPDTGYAQTAPPVTPLASAPIPSTPAAPSAPAPSASRIGSLPVESVYTPGSAPGATSSGSEIRLTSLPGEYRPGGTGTYRPKISVASKPGAVNEAPKTAPVAPVYPSTQLR